MKRSSFLVFALLAGSAGGASAQNGALSWSQIDDMSASQRRYAINQLYAKHGWVFSDMNIRRQFLKFDWYRPVPGRTMAQVKARFTRGERVSLERLTSARHESQTDDSGDENNSSSFEGEHFPATRLHVLSDDEVEEMSYAQLRYAINEIYARHNYRFSDSALRHQFGKFDWYDPSDISMNQVRHELSGVEGTNLEILSAARDAR